MSGGNGPKLELKLNLSPPRVNLNLRVESPPTEISPAQSSCVSSEVQEVDSSSSTTTGPNAAEEEEEETITSMLLVGCPRCLMYVLLSENEPKCPKCNSSTVLLEFSP